MKRLLLVALLAGCSKETAAPAGVDAGATPSATATTAAATLAPSVSAPVNAAGATGATAPAGKARSVAGPYQATKGSLYIPDSGGWNGVKWPEDDDTTGIGAGTLSLAIGADGRVSGTIAGALGDLTVDGLDRDGELTAQLLPAAGAAIGAFTGTLIAKDDGTKVTGKMRLSDGINRLVRVADVSLSTGG